MEPTRREFMAIAGATALGCGAISAKGDTEPREEKQSANKLQVGDEVMLISSPEYGIGRIMSCVHDRHIVWFPSRPPCQYVTKKDLVRVLPGSLEVGDRVICVDSGPTWIGRCKPVMGQRGTIDAQGSDIQSVHFDGDHPTMLWLTPKNCPELVKIQELVG